MVLLVLVFVVVVVFVLEVLRFLFLSRTVVTVGDIAVPFVARIETIGVGVGIISSTGFVYCKNGLVMKSLKINNSYYTFI